MRIAITGENVVHLARIRDQTEKINKRGSIREGWTISSSTGPHVYSCLVCRLVLLELPIKNLTVSVSFSISVELQLFLVL